MRLYGLVMYLIGLLPLYNSESGLNVTVCLMTYIYIYIDVGCCLCTVQRAGCVFRDVVSISEVKTLCLLLINRQFL